MRSLQQKARVLNKLLHSLLDGKNNEQRHVLDRHPNRSNDHPTVCDQDSVRICSLDVNMNNIDEKLLLYCRCLETLTFSLHKDVENVD
jgi:hypothetical protein